MGPVSKASKVLGAFPVLFPDDGVKGVAKTCHCGGVTVYHPASGGPTVPRRDGRL